MNAMVLALLSAVCTVNVDFTRPAGKMLPLHGVNNAPMNLWGKQNEFIEAGIPFCRTHDTGGAYGGAHYIDIPNVFPDFNADPEKPESYDFALTDAWLQTLVSSGVEPFYRLGVTIEGGRRLIKTYNINPPSDYGKWAKVAEHVIRHYTEGWANGKKWKIRYWEIWNEPDNPDMWTGTKEQFFEFYATVSRHLKEKFPHLRIGGYASCGFYETDDPHVSLKYANGSWLDWFTNFVAYATSPATKCPVDFFSWHIYTDEPARVSRHAKYCRDYLDAHGLGSTESILNEWNLINFKKYGRDTVFDLQKGPMGAAFSAAVMCRLQREGTVSKAMYYDAYPARTYCGLFYFPSMRTTPCYESFRSFGALYRLGDSYSACSSDPAVEVAAASDGRHRAILLVNCSDKGVDVKLSVKNADGGSEMQRRWLRPWAVESLGMMNDSVNLEPGAYGGHLQDVCRAGDYLYWAHTREILKTDLAGRVIASVRDSDHNAGCRVKDGRLYVAVCRVGGRITQENIRDHRLQVNVYDANDLHLIERRFVENAFDRAGSLEILPNGNFIVGCLRPPEVREDQVRFYVLDPKLKVLSRHEIDDMKVPLGIEVIKYFRGDLFFFMYGGKTVRLDAETLVEKGRYDNTAGQLGCIIEDDGYWTGVSKARAGTEPKVFDSQLVKRPLSKLGIVGCNQ